jgi:hypothetical protein
MHSFKEATGGEAKKFRAIERAVLFSRLNDEADGGVLLFPEL